VHPLHALVAEFSSPKLEVADATSHPRLSVVEVTGSFHVDFFGSPFEETYEALCTELRRSEVATALASLTLRGPDEGMNGTCNWNLFGFMSKKAQFPVLRSLSVQQNGPSNHNRIVVASEYEEGGILGRILQASPVLDTLVVPSAPDASFFEVQNHPLRNLNVDAGYDAQNFVANLADSSAFPKLHCLEFGEYNETYMEDFASKCTPKADYARLFSSPAFASVAAFTWRNPLLSAEEIAELRNLCQRKDLQFRVVRFSAEYVKRAT
jgi:hypothetical protein